MTFVRGVAAVVLRVAAFAVLYVVMLAVLSRSDSTDPLGAGLLFFLIVFVVAALWAVVDAVRRGFSAAAGLWVLTALLAGVAMTFVFVATTDDTVLSEELADSSVFFALLVGVPAAIGTIVGGLVHRARRPSPAA